VETSVTDPHLNSVHLDLGRREEFRHARRALLDACGPQTIQFQAKPCFGPNDTYAEIAAEKRRSRAGITCWVLLQHNQAFPLKVGLNTVGRLPDNDVVVVDPHVSRRHCAILVHASERCEVHDVASKNGTFLNGEKVTCPTCLKPGDEIRMGDLRLVFANDGAATPDEGHTCTI
jgi:hypothetical protein